MEKEPGGSQNGEIGTDNSDTDAAMLDALLAELDFQETPELAMARQEVLEALSENTSDPTRRHMAWREFIRIGEALVDVTVGLDNIEERAKMHVALGIREARISRDAGLHEGYIANLRHVYELAVNTGQASTASGIKDVLDLLAQN